MFFLNHADIDSVHIEAAPFQCQCRFKIQSWRVYNVPTFRLPAVEGINNLIVSVPIYQFIHLFLQIQTQRHASLEKYSCAASLCSYIFFRVHAFVM